MLFIYPSLLSAQGCCISEFKSNVAWMNSTEGQKTIHWHRKWTWQRERGGEIHPMKTVKPKRMNCQKEMFVICCSSKMAPRMAASVLRSLALFLFLFIFCAFGHSDHITFSRDQLLNIRQSSHYSSYPFFTNPESFLEILVGGAAALCGSWRRRRRGSRAGETTSARIPHGTPLHSPRESPLSSKQSRRITALKPD